MHLKSLQQVASKVWVAVTVVSVAVSVADVRVLFALVEVAVAVAEVGSMLQCPGMLVSGDKL